MKDTKHKVNLSLQVVPVNMENGYPAIDEAIYAIQASGVRHEVQPFSTVMEGTLEELWEVVQQAKSAAVNAGADELLLNIQIHLKAKADVSLAEKTDKFTTDQQDSSRATG